METLGACGLQRIASNADCIGRLNCPLYPWHQLKPADSVGLDFGSHHTDAPAQHHRECHQNFFGIPACFKTAFAVWRDLILLSTGKRTLVIGLDQIS